LLAQSGTLRVLFVPELSGAWRSGALPDELHEVECETP